MTPPRLDDTEPADSLLRAVAAAPPLAVQPGAQVGARLGPFQLVSRLGAGGFGVVFEARDTRDGARVALKVSHHADADWVVRFKREFRTLSSLSHPNLVRMGELGTDGETLYFSMEQIEGTSFMDFVAGGEAALRSAFAQLAGALAALHASGVLHRDVKPSNVLVERAGRVVLLDFGLAATLERDRRTSMAGTPYYMSPEQCAFEPATAASDLYAVGVMLFEALAGRGPFDAPLAQMMAQKQSALLPELAELAPQAPADLVALALALLARDPARRPTAPQLLERLGGPAGPIAVLIERSEELVGRDEELARLHRARERAARGPVLALIAGASGMGKTALMSRFLDEAAAGGGLCLIGRCYEHERVPYKALDAVVDELVRELARLPKPRLLELMPRDAFALGRIFPATRALEPIRDAPARGDLTDPTDLRRRGMGALRELLARLADRRTVIVGVDDLQWGDADSAALLQELLRPPDGPHLLFVGTLRPDEAATSPFLRALEEAKRRALAGVAREELHIGELPAPLTRELALRLLAREGSDLALAERIERDAGGCPFLVQELARGSALDGTRAEIQDVVARRLDALGAGARRVARLVALAGQPIPLSVVSGLVSGADGLRLMLAELKSARLLRQRGADHEVSLEPYHDRIRQAVLAHTDPEVTRSLHAELADAFLALGEGAEAQASLHLEGAGRLEEAALAALAVARVARAAFAFEQSASLVRRALALWRRGGGLSLDEERALLIELADDLTLSFAGSEAADMYLAAARLSAGIESLELRGRAASQLFLTGHVERGLGVLAAVLTHVGEATPKAGVVGYATLAAQVAKLRVRGLSFTARAERDVPPIDLLRVDALCTSSFNLFMLEPVVGLSQQLRALSKALELGEPRRVLLALSRQLMVEAAGGVELTSSLAPMRELARRLDTGEAHHMASSAAAWAASFDGRWREALALFEEVDRYASFRDPHLPGQWHTSMPRFDALYWMGRAGETAERLPSALAMLEQRDDVFGVAWLTLVWSWLRCLHGETEEARSLVEHAMRVWGFERREGFVPSLWRATNLGNIALHEGDGERAAAAVDALRPPAGMAWLGRQVMAQLAWMRGRSAIAIACRRPARRGAAVEEARRQAREAAATKIRWSSGVAEVLEAAAAALSGDERSAVRRLASAERQLAEVDMEMMVAVVKRARGRLLGGDAGRALVAEGEAWIRAQGVSDAARCAAMYAPGPWT